MGKVDRLRNRVEPFTVLFWDLRIVLANLTLHAAVLIWSQLVQFSAKTRCPLPFSYPILCEKGVGVIDYIQVAQYQHRQRVRGVTPHSTSSKNPVIHQGPVTEAGFEAGGAA